MASQLVLLVLLVLSMVSTITGTTASMGASTVRVLVTSIVTVNPANTNTVTPATSLQARQWAVSPSVPAWSAPAWTQQPPVWSEPATPWTQSVWSQQPSWTPTIQAPAAPAATTTTLVSSPTDSYESTHQPNPKETLSSGIVAAAVFGGFFALCLLSALVIVVMRKCVYRKDTSASTDVEMTAGMRPGTSDTANTGGVRSTMDSVEQYVPQRPRSVLNAAPSIWQPVHWPPEEVPGLMAPANVHWSRERGYLPD